MVHIEIHVPPSMPAHELATLQAAEAERARALAAEGTLVRIWRVPGRRANVGLWQAPDATALHEALTSLPMHPHMDVRVEPLAAHPSDPARG